MSSHVIIVSAIISLLILPSFGSDALIERKGLTPVGQIIDVAGKAFVKLVPEENFRAALVRQALVPNDVIKTAGGARLAILFLDATQLKLSSNTTLIIKEVSQNREKPGTLKILLRLESGEVWTRSKGVTDGLMIETPYATATIRGTEWVISVKGDETTVAVMEGNVQFFNPSGSVNVGRNEQAVISQSNAPVKSILIRPRDRTQWTYYLPRKRLLRYLKFRGISLNEAELLFNSGELRESQYAFERILSREPDNAEALAGLGMIELKKGDSEEARRYLERSLSLKKTSPALLGLTYVALIGNETEEATRFLRQARELSPGDPLPYIFSSYLHAYAGDFSGALRKSDEGLSVFPNNPSILAFKTDLYFILDEPAEAKRSIDALLREYPDSSQGYERLGLYERMVTGNSREAKEAFQKAVLLDPLNDGAMAKLSDLLREEGYIPESRRLIMKALSLAPWNAMYHYNYGRILADINKIDEARTEFQTSLRLDPTFSRAYLGEGIILLKEGRPTEALRELAKASLFEPSLSEIHTFLAIAYYQRGDARSALEELKTAEECDSLDSTPHQLASAIDTDHYRPVAAIAEARKVLDLLPYRKASGEALLEAGQNGVMSVNKGLDMLRLPEWSLYYAQKALFFDPYRNTSHIGAGLAYDQLGRISSLQGFNEFANATASELLTGLFLNVTSLNFSNRYSMLISKPGHYFTLGGDYAFGSSTGFGADLALSGDFGVRFPLTYFFSSRGFKDSGYLEHGGYKTGSANLVLGYKPSYDQDLYMNLSYIDQRGDITPAASNSLTAAFDNNQTFKDRLGWVQLGYHLRLNPISHLIAAVRYVSSDGKVENPDFSVDPSGFSRNQNKSHNFAAGVRHLLTLWKNHQVSYGIDYNSLDITLNEDWPYAYPTAILLLGNSIEPRFRENLIKIPYLGGF
jgi:tetratricopeptide (TPR) repeat protein